MLFSVKKTRKCVFYGLVLSSVINKEIIV